MIFSVGLVTGDDVPGPESVDSPLSEAAFAASSLTDFYKAMGRPLPSMARRAEIYAALGLGAVAAYRGTADQNAALLKALKERAVAPLFAAELT